MKKIILGYFGFLATIAVGALVWNYCNLPLGLIIMSSLIGIFNCIISALLIISGHNDLGTFKNL